MNLETANDEAHRGTRAGTIGGPDAGPATRTAAWLRRAGARLAPDRWLRRAGARLAPDRWWLGAGAVCLAGLGLRLYVVLVARPACSPDPAETGCFRINGDVLYHFTQGRLIGDGHFFKNGIEHLASGRLVESAGDPPGFALLLGAWSAAGFDSVDWQRGLACFVGAATVLAVAVLARRLAGDRAGWIAGALAAAHPLLWINDVMLMSESLYQPMVVLVMFAAFAYAETPDRRQAALLGATIAAAALVRAEAALLVLVMLAPLCLTTRTVAPTERFRQLLAGAFTALLVVSPWLVYNNLRFEAPVTLSSGSGLVLMAGSCETAWSGPRMGSWWDCFTERGLWDEYEAEFPGITDTPPEARTLYDESLIDAFNRRHALAWIDDNLARLPQVMLARAGRALDFFRVQDSLDNNAGLEGRWRRPSQAGLALYYLLIVPAAVGAFRMRRAGLRLAPLLAWWPMVVGTAVLTFALTRYRVPVDIAMIVLAAVAVGTPRPSSAEAAAERPSDSGP